jgi:hypothetical protein
MSVPVVSCAMPDGSAPLTDLTQQLVGLQAHVATLEHQLSLLLEQLQKEQEWPTSHASTVQDKSQESSQDKSQESSQDKSQESSQDKSQESSQDKSQESSQDKSQESSQDKSQESSQDKSQDKGSALTRTQAPSIDRRKHPHVLPVVEYSAQGKYVLITPEEGMLSFEPDSPAWFAWLATLPSFRFVGKLGRFTAFRGYQCSASTPWWAHRQIRNHSHKRRLGMTASVTIECLELAASSLQALV